MPDHHAAADFLAGKPDYDGRSIVNLMASVSAACGAEPRYALLEQLPPDELAAARHIVLMVIDGLGYRYLRSSAAAPALQACLRGSMTSVFPPTTAAAITTFLTGLAPQQHALTGWFMFMRELGSVVAVLPFNTRLGGIPLAKLGISPREAFGITPIFPSLHRDCFSVSPREIAFSPFNQIHSEGARVRPYQTLPELFGEVERIVKGHDGPTYTYAYWPRLDQLAHARGIGHPDADRHLRQIDAAFEAFLAHLRGTDTLVVVTADHGFMDIAPGGLVRLADHPELASTLLVPLCGEPRAAYCYAAPHRADDLVAAAESLHGRAHCRTSLDLLAQGWFGPGEPHPELAARIGDYTLIMREGCAIMDELPGEERSGVIGVHGGVSAAEQRVPLIVARC